jgi:hypothetical protein
MKLAQHEGLKLYPLNNPPPLMSQDLRMRVNPAHSLEKPRRKKHRRTPPAWAKTQRLPRFGSGFDEFRKPGIKTLTPIKMY